LSALAVVSLAALVAVVGASLAAREGQKSAEPIVLSEPKRRAAADAARTPARRQMPIPVRISIPRIGVDARVVALGLNRDRTVEVPKNFADTGWFRPGPEPGERGAAVILGHLDSRRGPAVFFRLHLLRAGDLIKVRLRDGSTVRFVAKAMERVKKNRFPTKRVYVHSGPPSLRLVTCAGPLNRSTGHHADNYIVYASMLR